MLDPLSRAALVAMSVLCIGGAVALTPTRARSSNDLSAHPQVPATPPVAAAVREIAIRRDPFAGEVSHSPTAAGASLAATPVSPPSHALSTLPGGDLGPLPGNLARSTIPAIPGAAPATAVLPRVTAIVTGPHPYAMIDSSGSHEIKGIGDRVGGTPIRAIDINGVTLQSGAHLTVAPGEVSQ